MSPGALTEPMGGFKLKLVAYFLLLSVLPLAAAAVGFDAVAKRSETRRVDARLQAALRSSLTAYGDELSAAEAEAAAVAHDGSFLQALATRNRATLHAILRASPNLSVRAGNGFRVGSVPPLAAERHVAVVVPGAGLGEVVASVPLDSTLIGHLRARSGLGADDRLAFVRHGQIAIGPSGLSGRLVLAPGQTTTVKVNGTRYRALMATSLREPADATLAVFAPQAEIDRATTSLVRRLLLGLLASMALIGLLAYFEGRSIVRTLRRLVDAANAIAHGRLAERVEVRGRDEFALLGRAFNEMAGQLELRLAELEAERRRLREATSRFEEALSATHDIDHLLRVIVETAVESTGAMGGLVIRPTGEIIQAGDPEAGSERLELLLGAGRDGYGTLVLNGRNFDVEARETAVSLCAHAAIALENARLHRIVERQALVDGLTGLPNRRHSSDVLAAEIVRAARFEESLALVLADLDDFKAINDRHGHPFGDVVLQEFASTLRESVREVDLAGRWGGEEFALILPGTDLAGGARLAERARRALEGRAIRAPDGTQVALTASFGVAAFPDAAGEEELVAAADAALYAAKGTGKNRVVTAKAPARRP